MRINLDYKLSDTYKKNANIECNQDLTVNLINFAVNAKYKDGLKSGSLRRVYARLQRLLDEAIENKSDTIELEQAQKDLLIDVFNFEIPVPVFETKYFVLLEDEIESLKDKVPTEEKNKE